MTFISLSINGLRCLWRHRRLVLSKVYEVEGDGNGEDEDDGEDFI